MSLKSLLNPYRGLPKEVYVIFIARVINAMGCFVMPLLTIILTESIGMSKQMAGFYLSLAGFLYMPASMLGGKLADTIGRKKVIVLFDGLAILLYILAGLTPPNLSLVYVLILAGMSLTTAGPAHDSLMADLTTPANRNGAYALSYMGWNLGFAFGPVIGGMLYKNHLPLVFWGDAFTALLALILILVFIKETLHRTHEKIQDPKRQMEQRVEGSIFSVLWSRPVLIYFAVIAFGYNFAYSQWSFMLPMQAIEKWDSAGATYYGFIAGFNGLVVMLFTPLLTKLTEGIQDIRRMVFGGLLYAVGFGMLGMINTLPFFFVGAFTFTIGEIVLAISTIPFIANRTPASHRGRMNAFVPMIFGLGNTLGPLGMGKVLEYISIESGWLLIGLSTLGFSALMYGLEKSEARREFLDSESTDTEISL